MATSFLERQTDALKGAEAALAAFSITSQLLLLPFEGSNILLVPEYKIDNHPAVLIEVEHQPALYTFMAYIRRTEEGQKIVAIDFAVSMQKRTEGCRFIPIGESFRPSDLSEETVNAIPVAERPEAFKAWLKSRGQGCWYQLA